MTYISKRTGKTGHPERLGDTLAELMTSSLQPKHEMFEAVAKFWDEVVPAEVKEHCRITSISNGRIRVAVDSPTYLYQIRLSSAGLLATLRDQGPSARFKKIDCFIG